MGTDVDITVTSHHYTSFAVSAAVVGQAFIGVMVADEPSQWHGRADDMTLRRSQRGCVKVCQTAAGWGISFRQTMDRYQRILQLHRMLSQARHPIRISTLQDEMDCSRATIYRDISFLRDGLGAPIEQGETDGAAIHYRAGERFELPGLWLSSDELAALLALNELLDQSDAGVLSGALAPFRSRIERLLSDHADGARLPINRIRVIHSGSRAVNQESFRVVAGAVLHRRRLTFTYRARNSDQITERTVSPQRLAHYRDNWYLDALDHSRDALRSFALDRIKQPRALAEPAQDHPEEELDSHLTSSYGIFSGAPRAWATIRFSDRAARWVADEHWHPQQEGRRLADGSYELRLPYSTSRELLMDVLRYGPDAEVMEPVPLREEMKIMLQLALAQYTSGATG